MKKYKTSLFPALLLATGLASCDYIHEDLEPCPTGLYLDFTYNYNLQRADLFHDHVGSVTAYIYDKEGHFLLSKSESGAMLRDHNYRMPIDLEPGHYQYVAVASQRPLKEQSARRGARFRVAEPVEGAERSALTVSLDHVSGVANGVDTVPHQGLPLDTLWMGHSLKPVEVKVGRETVDTVSLVRDTKQIHVVLRDLDQPQSVDVADFDFRIYDRNATLQWNNRVVEKDTLCYTPYARWNTQDKPVEGKQLAAAGRMAHVDFMTSRILYHDKGKEDAVLSITNRKTGVEVVRINLADMLSRLRTSAEMHAYSPQEFLDRGYDYRLAFFLKGDRWEYVEIEIGVLSWSKRIQYENFGF